MSQKQTFALSIGIVIILIIMLGIYLFGMQKDTNIVTSVNVETASSTDPTETKTTNNTHVSGTTNYPRTTTGTPPSTTPTTPATYELKIGQSVTVSSITTTVVSVAEDSRCPIGSQCIWAGTVKVNVKLQKGTISTTQVVELNKPLGALGFSAELIKVTPEKENGKTFPSTDYRFTFTLAKS